MLPTRDPFHIERHTQTESEGMEEKVLNRNGKKNAGGAIFTSGKMEFKTRAVIRDKERYFIMIKGAIQQEDTTLINI